MPPWQAHTGKEMLDLFERHQPDLLFLDVKPPDASGIQLAEKVRLGNPQIPIIIVTSCEEPYLLRQLLQAPINALLSKLHTTADMGLALQHLSSLQAAPFVDTAIQSILATSQDTALTKREWEVLAFISKGLTNEGIAKQLGCSVETVKTHRSNLGRKTCTYTRSELTAWYIQKSGRLPSGT